MGRPLRTLDLDSVVHAGSRGSNRYPIAFSAEDYESLIGEIGRAAVRYRWHVLAWCVMPNHYHLVMRMTRGGFSAGFREINGNHSRRTNARLGREAHLWKNRPWHVIQRSPAQLIGAITYTLRNPVAAELCVRPHEWRHSSFAATVGAADPPRWFDPAETLRLFGGDPAEARHALAAVVQTGHLLVSDTGVPG